MRSIPLALLEHLQFLKTKDGKCGIRDEFPVLRELMPPCLRWHNRPAQADVQLLRVAYLVQDVSTAPD